MPPKKHDHVGYMLFEDDFCCCRYPGCEQKWELTKQGWQPMLGLNARSGGNRPPRRPMRAKSAKKGLNRARKR